MPLITMKDIESLSPIFKGEKGNKTAKRLLRLMGIDRLAKHYEKFEHLLGPDFVAAYLKDVGVEYQVEGIENLLSLTDGPFITVSNHPYGALDGLILLRVGIGPVISVEEQQECANWKDLGLKLREAVYGMDKKMRRI